MIYSVMVLALIFIIIGWLVLLIFRSPLLRQPLGGQQGNISSSPKPLRDYHWIWTSWPTMIALYVIGVLLAMMVVLLRVPPLTWYPEAGSLERTGFEGYAIGEGKAKISYIVTNELSAKGIIEQTSLAIAELATAVRATSDERLDEVQAFELSVRLQRPQSGKKSYDRLGNLVRPRLIGLELDVDDLREANLDRLNNEDLLGLAQLSFAHPKILAVCENVDETGTVRKFCVSARSLELLSAEPTE